MRKHHPDPGRDLELEAGRCFGSHAAKIGAFVAPGCEVALFMNHTDAFTVIGAGRHDTLAVGPRAGRAAPAVAGRLFLLDRARDGAIEAHPLDPTEAGAIAWVWEGTDVSEL